MTPASRLTQELSALDPLRMPASALLREVERMAHSVGSEAAGADATDLRALQEAAGGGGGRRGGWRVQALGTFSYA